jgi:hypothetical protein
MGKVGRWTEEGFCPISAWTIRKIPAKICLTFGKKGRSLSFMQTFIFDVSYTDRTRGADGRYNVVVRRVDVAGNGFIDAQCAAAQLVAALRDDIGGMVLATDVVI